MDNPKASFEVGDICVCTSQAARSGEFRIVSIALAYDVDPEGRFVYIIQFRNGILDAIPVISEAELHMKQVMTSWR